MTRLVVSAVLAAVVVLSVGVAQGRPAAKPQLRIADASPFTLVGTGFRAGETVRVTVRANTGGGSARDRAGTTGRIAVRFPRLKLGRCPVYLIIAKGDKGSSATLRSLPRPCGIDP
jgi:hypothetical protein